jgi:excinuclease ABC subunit C
VARMVFPIRTCSFAIQPDKPRRPCIHYQIGQCAAPCAGKIGQEEYAGIIDQVMDFLSGKFSPVLDDLNRRMAEAAREMNYERAAVYRDRIRAVESVMQKQKAISTAQGDRDVIACLDTGLDCVVQLLIVRSGRLIGSEHFLLEGAGGEAPGDILPQFMLQYCADGNQPPQEILLTADPPEKDVLEQLLSETAGRRVYLLRPMRGDKLKLTQMALKNARDEAAKREKRLLSSRERTVGALAELAEALWLPNPPRRIEGYDISNTQGAQSVGSMVVMIDGKCANRE